MEMHVRKPLYELYFFSESLNFRMKFHSKRYGRIAGKSVYDVKQNLDNSK